MFSREYLVSALFVRTKTTQKFTKGPFTKDVRAEMGEGVLENQDKLGHRGGGGEWGF